MTPLPPGCIDRLHEHYGHTVDGWLNDAPGMIEDACRAWGLTFSSYHDVGYASAISVVQDTDGRPAIVKAWPDPVRCVTETDALMCWYQDQVVHAVDAERNIGWLQMIGGRPGGAPAPDDELPLVAAALRDVHHVGRGEPRDASHRDLKTHIVAETLPRIARRASEQQPCELVDRARRALPTELPVDERRSTLLHGDLYRPNVLFDTHGAPVLTDPHPIVGDSIYDWAFWSVYYTLGIEMPERVGLACSIGRINHQDLRLWCLLLCVDGLLYYRETDNPSALTMESVLAQVLGNKAWSRCQRS